jgi:hypothetical protein
MLEKKIKKSLIETKEKKERKLIQETLIKNRLSMIVENVKTIEDFNKLSEDKKLKLSVKFLQELSFLNNNGLINEQNFGSILQSIFGGAFGNITQTLVEPFIEKILGGIGLNDYTPSLSVYDSPSTTSSTTYTLYIRTSSSTIGYELDTVPCTMTLMEISA